MNKRNAWIGRTLVLLLAVCLLLGAAPITARAARSAAGKDDAAYAVVVNDVGVLSFELRDNPTPGGAPVFWVFYGGSWQELSAVLSAGGIILPFYSGAMGGQWMAPGYEGAVTFEIKNVTTVPTVIKLWTEQLDDIRNYFIPLDEDDPNGPRDYKGDTGVNLEPNFGPTAFGPDYNAMRDLYKRFPANILDKIQVNVYTALDSVNPFRVNNAANSARAPDGINADHGNPGHVITRVENDWYTVVGDRSVGRLLRPSDTLYVHYTFHWDGDPVDTDLGSPVSPKAYKYADEYGPGDLSSGYEGFAMSDNYFMGVGALIQWSLSAEQEMGYTVRYMDEDTGLWIATERTIWEGDPRFPPLAPTFDYSFFAGTGLILNIPNYTYQRSLYELPNGGTAVFGTADGTVSVSFMLDEDDADNNVIIVVYKRIPPPPSPQPNPSPFPSPSPSVSPSPPPPPTGEPEDPSPSISPSPDPEETLQPSPPPTGPGMPFTGGFNLGDLLFIGLFLFGIGLIYLNSRKREEIKGENY